MRPLLLLTLIIFVLLNSLPISMEARPFSQTRPTMRAKSKGQHRLHRPNYRTYRAYHYY
ncbi:hypothetical protein [Hymenobacter amundsenii]|uniref:hypothetical protein n=1 Tax=Hymenobacter amundsenii TaxID=2006685 RepID=UPI0013FE4B1D|nr:hypothetical protein [Hymenobacter amundsenii]